MLPAVARKRARAEVMTRILSSSYSSSAIEDDISLGSSNGNNENDTLNQSPNKL